jgi:hypothetical protein
MPFMLVDGDFCAPLLCPEVISGTANDRCLLLSFDDEDKVKRENLY